MKSGLHRPAKGLGGLAVLSIIADIGVAWGKGSKSSSSCGEASGPFTSSTGAFDERWSKGGGSIIIGFPDVVKVRPGGSH